MTAAEKSLEKQVTTENLGLFVVDWGDLNHKQRGVISRDSPLFLSCPFLM